MGFFELIEKRVSVRSYTNQPVEDEKLQKILEAARLAPTACNRQAFKLVVIKTADKENELKKIYNKDWFAQAPIILGIFSIPEKNWVRFDGWNYSDVDSTIAFDHVILAAESLGLGTCWIGAFDPKAAKEIVGLGEGYEPVAFTPLGYAGKLDYTKTRKPLDELVVHID